VKIEKLTNAPKRRDYLSLFSAQMVDWASEQITPARQPPKPTLTPGSAQRLDATTASLTFPHEEEYMAQIKEHMKVVVKDGAPVGTVDEVEDDRINRRRRIARNVTRTTTTSTRSSSVPRG
jgi:hypothetical protein